MNKSLLDEEVQNFIINYQGSLPELAFKGSPFKNIENQFLLEQIESRNKAKSKLPSWYKSQNIIYPPKLNLEQTSSEITAKYKASLVSGKILADITGGFGVDSFYFAERFEKVLHFEINKDLSEIAAHNFDVFGKENISTFCKDGLQFVLTNMVDAVFADPSRRHESKGKVFFLEDCEPNIPKHLKDILENCNILMVKTSPMLDLTVGLNELKHVESVHIIAVDNEVKELIWILRKNVNTDTKIETINFTKTHIEKFDYPASQSYEAVYSKPLRFLYEPNAAILKSGNFDGVSELFKLKKLHKNTHLYTSDALREFPGRRFIIEECIPYNKKAIKTALTFPKANITIRNFQESVDQLRKKWNIKDGGEHYLFFTTGLEDQRILLICKKV